MSANKFTSRFFVSYERDFFKGLEDLLSQIQDIAAPMRLCFFFGAGESQTYSVLSRRLIQRVEAFYHCKLTPSVSLVFLKPLGSVQIALELQCLSGYMVTSIDREDTHCLCAENESEKWLFVSGLVGSGSDVSVLSQSATIFFKLDRILSAIGGRPRHIIRQWNYIERITSAKAGKQNYMLFNNARSKFYKAQDWSLQGYPAATGIGSIGGGTIVDVMVMVPKPGCPTIVRPITSPLQHNAHEYSKAVIKTDGQGYEDATPKFERAKLVAGPMGTYCFISGTAAIRGEESLEADGFERQMSATIVAVKELIRSDNLARQGWNSTKEMSMKSIRVYIKHSSDYSQARYMIQTAFPGVPCIYLQADICREELLVEMEGIASIE